MFAIAAFREMTLWAFFTGQNKFSFRNLLWAASRRGRTYFANGHCTFRELSLWRNVSGILSSEIAKTAGALTATFRRLAKS